MPTARAQVDELVSKAGVPAFAWAVHAYTASGALAAFFGTLAVFEGRYRAAFLWMVFATFVDASDGVLARLARVKETLPGFDGGRLDDIVDYLCWVFAPMVLLVQAGILPAWAAAVPLLASAYGFGQVEAKTEDDDHYFVGFPSYWSILGFYFYEFGASPRTAVPLTLAFSVLVFVPLRYPYPTKTRALRPVTLGLGVPWALLTIWLAARLPERPTGPALLSLYYPACYCLLTGALRWRRRQLRPAA